MARKTVAAISTAAALAAPVAIAPSASATEGGATILGVVSSADRFTSTEKDGLDVFRWDQRNWYDFDILTAAVVANGTFAGAVTDPRTAVTLFAPTDSAFQLLAKDLTGKWYFTEKGVLNAIVAAVGTGEALTKVLSYHLVAGKFIKADVPLSTPIATLNEGQSVTVKPTRFGITIQDAAPLRDPYLVGTDIDAGHSVIHSISRMLVPGNL